MATVLIIAAVFAAVYLYAAAAYYYGFRDWRPLCGGNGAACKPKRTSKA